MKCQILFSGKNKKNIINLSSVEFVQKVIIVNKHSVHKNILTFTVSKLVLSNHL